MKGIVLAGGAGSRLAPLTRGVSKQLMPVYDKPLIYYPLSVLMLAGIREILIITTPRDLSSFERLLGDGSWLGLHFEYRTQAKPEGIAQSFLIASDFIGQDSVCLILGDNIFFGNGLPEFLASAASRPTGATIFAYQVRDPERYGVVAFDADGQATSLEEKPTRPQSRFAITGLYYYDNRVVEIARGLKPSSRGELEITDVNRAYLGRGQLHVEQLGRGIAWLDTGTHESLLHASNFIHALQERQGLMAACLEEIAYNSGLITADDVRRHAASMGGNQYAEYLRQIVDSDRR